MPKNPILLGEAEPLGIRVVATDLATGQTSEVTIQPGNYVFVVAAPCYIANEVHHGNGTSVVTLRGRSPGLMTTVVQPVEEADRG